MIASYSGNAHGETLTAKPTPQNKIYYGTRFKRTNIFRHPYKKCKWPNYRRYLPQTHRYPTIPPL